MRVRYRNIRIPSPWRRGPHRAPHLCLQLLPQTRVLPRSRAALYVHLARSTRCRPARSGGQHRAQCVLPNCKARDGGAARRNAHNRRRAGTSHVKRAQAVQPPSALLGIYTRRRVQHCTNKTHQRSLKLIAGCTRGLRGVFSRKVLDPHNLAHAAPLRHRQCAGSRRVNGDIQGIGHPARTNKPGRR